MGSEVAQQPEGQVVQQTKSSQSNQPNPNPDHHRTGDPLFAHSERLKHVLTRDSEDTFNLVEEDIKSR